MKKYEEKVNKICNMVIEKYALLKDSIQFNLQNNINCGEYLLQFYEEEYPRNGVLSMNNGVYRPILIFKENQKGKYAGNIEITISRNQSENIDIPKTVISKLKSNNYSETFRFEQDDENMFKFIEDNILYKLKSYQSSSSFGCCSRFDECEKQHKCIHPNYLYATGCMLKRYVIK